MSQLDYQNTLFTCLPDQALHKPQHSKNIEAGGIRSCQWAQPTAPMLRAKQEPQARQQTAVLASQPTSNNSSPCLHQQRAQEIDLAPLGVIWLLMTRQREVQDLLSTVWCSTHQNIHFPYPGKKQICLHTLPEPRDSPVKFSQQTHSSSAQTYLFH